MAHDLDQRRRHGRSRSRSPHRKSRHEHRDRRHRSPLPTKPLPFAARLLDRHDFGAYKVIFAAYLDLQKQINIEDLSESETKGRFKSFISKWNRGELAEGWYDPQRLHAKPSRPASPPKRQREIQPITKHVSDGPEPGDSDDDFGPAPALPSSTNSRAGPSIPTIDDLALRKEHEAEDRESAIALAKASRRAESRLEKQRLDELAPRAEAGTRERQLEKKRELAASNRAFADSKAGGAGGSGLAEVNEGDLMGGGDDDSLEGVKRKKQEEERKLSERELRREEYARARREEVEQRKQDFLDKEAERTQRFIELAKQRFG